VMNMSPRSGSVPVAFVLYWMVGGDACRLAYGTPNTFAVVVGGGMRGLADDPNWNELLLVRNLVR